VYLKVINRTLAALNRPTNPNNLTLAHPTARSPTPVPTPSTIEIGFSPSTTPEPEPPVPLGKPLALPPKVVIAESQPEPSKAPNKNKSTPATKRKVDQLYEDLYKSSRKKPAEELVELYKKTETKFAAIKKLLRKYQSDIKEELAKAKADLQAIEKEESTSTVEKSKKELVKCILNHNVTILSEVIKE